MQRLRDYLWPVLFCVGGLLIAHHETLLSGFALTQNDPGDTRFVHYLLEHGWRWLLRQPGHLELWSPGYFFPAQNVGAYSESALLAVPFYAPWRIVGFPPDTAFQLWLLSVGTANFTISYLLFTKSLKLGKLGSAAGAALFAFGAVRINQTMHPQLFAAMWTVLCVFAITRLFSDDAVEQTPKRRRVWIFVAGLAAAAQFWSGFYLGWFMLLGLTVAFVWALILGTSRRAVVALMKQHPVALGLAALVSAAAIAPMAVHYLAASREVGMRSYGEAMTMIPPPQAWLHLGQFSWAYAWMGKLELFRAIPMEHEQRIGSGLIATAACVAGLVLGGRKNPGVRFLALCGLTFVLLSTRLGEYTLWRLVFEYFPGAKAIRGVSRIGIVTMLPLGLGVAAFVSWLEGKGRAAAAGAIGLSAVVLLEQGETTPAFSKLQMREDIAAISKAIPAGCGAFVFSPLQGYGPMWKYQLDAMWAHMQSGVPTLNGYSGNNPPGWPLGDTNLHDERDEHRVSYQVNQWMQLQKLDPSKVCWVKVGLQEGPYRAEFVSQEMPPVMRAGQRYPVAVTYRNGGTLPWRAGEPFRLGAQAPRDTSRWGLNRVLLPSEVPPGGSVTFRFEVMAPPSAGVHPFQWRMVREGMMWIGETTPLTAVQVE